MFPQKISNSRYKKAIQVMISLMGGGGGLGGYNSTTAKLFVEVSGVTGW